MPVASSIRRTVRSTSRDITGGLSPDDSFEVKPCPRRARRGPGQRGQERGPGRHRRQERDREEQGRQERDGGTADRPHQARTSQARAATAAGRGPGTPVIEDDPGQRGPAVWMQITTFVLALAGLGVSVYLTIAHFTESALAGCSDRAW